VRLLLWGNEAPQHGFISDDPNVSLSALGKTMNAIQDSYPDELSHCYGCGRLNLDGLQIKSVWNGH
jgi:hypothetical protein